MGDSRARTPALRIADIARARLQELRSTASPPVFLDPAFPAQTRFISDPAKLKALLCTRRAGKSYGAGLYLCQEAFENAGVSCLYIALTRDSAKKIMWKDVLKPISRKLGLEARFNETELTATLPNGSVIYLLGVDSAEDEKKKLLGQKYKLIIVDEAAQFTVDLNELIYGVLKPAVADYRGTICLLGTPGNLKAGLFFDVTSGQDPGVAGTWQRAGWSGHRWSALDNPYIRDNWLQEIADLKAANPRIEETPLFQQHYLGRWVVDDTKLVYRCLAGRNEFDGTLPTFRTGRWRYVLGIDLGYSDPTAFSVCAYHDHDRVMYVLETEKRAGMDITATAERIRRYQAVYDFDALVIDNANKQAVEEMRRRHQLPLLPADKTGKSDFIELMNGEFIQGHIKLDSNRCAPLIEEYANLIWDDRSDKREEHPNCPNHLTDATLYGWRHVYAYLAEALVEPPAPGTPEHEELIMEECLAVLLQEYEEQKRAEEAWTWH